MEKKMTRRSWMRSSLTTLASLAAASSLPIHLKGNIVPAVIPLKGGTNQNRSKVLMTKEISPDALVKIYEALKHPDELPSKSVQANRADIISCSRL